MALSRKNKYKLIDVLSRQFIENGVIIIILTAAGVPNINGIDLNGSPSIKWKNIIEHCEEYSKINDLIATILERYSKFSELIKIVGNMAREDPVISCNEISNYILNRKCTLFIGPQLLKAVVGGVFGTFEFHLNSKLVRALERELNIYFDINERNNLSYIIDRFQTKTGFFQSETEYFASKLYHSNNWMANLQIYDIIHELQFPLIINTNHDNIFNDNRYRYNVDQKYTYYKYNVSNSELKLFNKMEADKTIVYNIFGSFDSPDSIILTEKKAVTFAKRTYENNPPIPNVIKDIIKNTYSLFLGFDFKKWHFKILLDALELKEAPGNYCITDQLLNESDIEYYERQYNMSFIIKDTEEFMEDLRNKYLQRA